MELQVVCWGVIFFFSKASNVTLKIIVKTFLFILCLWSGFFAALPAFAQKPSAEQLMQEYASFHSKTLKRLFDLEDRIDGLTTEFRNLLGDRKKKHESTFKGPGKTLVDPVLLSVIISERKRLEKEDSFLEELKKHRGLSQQYLKKIGSNLLSLELSTLVITYVEYLDEFNRGVRGVPGSKKALDLDIMKVLAASLTAMDYSKDKKSKLYFSDPRIAALDPEGAQHALKIIESGLGKLNENSITDITGVTDKKELAKLEMERLKKTRHLILILNQLASQMSLTNKDLLDEYQYRVIQLKQKINHQRELSQNPPK
jgi:hypothetical protein